MDPVDPAAPSDYTTPSTMQSLLRRLVTDLSRTSEHLTTALALAQNTRDPALSTLSNLAGVLGMAQHMVSIEYLTRTRAIQIDRRSDERARRIREAPDPTTSLNLPRPDSDQTSTTNGGEAELRPVVTVHLPEPNESADADSTGSETDTGVNTS